VSVNLKGNLSGILVSSAAFFVISPFANSLRTVYHVGFSDTADTADDPSSELSVGYKSVRELVVLDSPELFE
jgi:hypothetical protein